MPRNTGRFYSTNIPTATNYPNQKHTRSCSVPRPSEGMESLYSPCLVVMQSKGIWRPEFVHPLYRENNGLTSNIIRPCTIITQHNARVYAQSPRHILLSLIDSKMRALEINHSVQQDPFFWANRSSVRREITSMLRNPNILHEDLLAYHHASREKKFGAKI
jgi:hypothetical protein